MSGRRQALKPFSFSNGTNVNKGEWVCTPAGAIMHSENHYPEPMEFHGFRFAEKKFVNHVLDRGVSQPNGPSKLTDVDDTWHVWGIGRITWCVDLDLSDNLIDTTLAPGDSMLQQLWKQYSHTLSGITTSIFLTRTRCARSHGDRAWFRGIAPW